ncbi:hypothetical protein EYF80_027533 [Liparis tanakae]|uniref:Uncharacterized protein n=1 Tax=Liparis tanakae TaxID=230148 RepID=A0A4Z2H8W9_9TELE|nr:hypothetical protein EYF80_027533 [Liparis tanakae]
MSAGVSIVGHGGGDILERLTWLVLLKLFHSFIHSSRVEGSSRSRCLACTSGEVSLLHLQQDDRSEEHVVAGQTGAVQVTIASGDKGRQREDHTDGDQSYLWLKGVYYGDKVQNSQAHKVDVSQMTTLKKEKTVGKIILDHLSIEFTSDRSGIFTLSWEARLRRRDFFWALRSKAALWP